MNILLIYPEYPDTFWSYKHALRFISKKATTPPLGLLTVAAMLPKKWNKKVIDMNVEKLREKNIQWADYVFISAMVIQKKSVKKVVNLCKRNNVKIVAGGPLFGASYENQDKKDILNLDNIDHLVLNEAEITLPLFLEDLKNNKAKHIYKSNEFADLKNTPIPLLNLIKINKYASMNIQYSRGCPFNCDFCDITNLFGRKVRTKDKFHVIAELENLYKHGWRGNVFFVDDNFIGNTPKLKQEILPAIIKWMRKRKNPFVFNTEVSINLADDEELMSMMTKAGFDSVFIGIETPNEESLTECNKFQNKNRNLVECVKKIQNFGFEVSAGFIVGFDNDTSSIFQEQIEFIKESGIIKAMVGLLNVPYNTKLYHRLKKENRLLEYASGSNTDLTLNFIPKMDKDKLIEGYKRIIKEIYSAKPYFKRVKKILKNKKIKSKLGHLKINLIIPFIKSIFILGIIDKERIHFWKIYFWSLFNNPRISMPLAITYAIYGFHFRKVFANCI